MPLKVIQNSVKRRVAIAAGKGGVGKSTFTVLLAAALVRQGERVGILDADLYGPSMGQMLPCDRQPIKNGTKWLPAMAQGIKLFSCAFFSGGAAIRAPVANQLLRQFFENVEWGELDWLLIDFPPGTGDIPITAAQLAQLNGAILITTPQKVALIDVQKTIDLLRKVNIPILGVIENMSYFKERSCTPFGSGGGRDLAAREGIPFLGEFPLEPAISESADSGRLAQLELPDLELLLKNVEENFDLSREAIKSITLVNRQTIKIDWEEGLSTLLQAAPLQKSCPCAQCQTNQAVDEKVGFDGYEMVGRYGLRFNFSSGCSFGIYPFDLVKRLCYE